MLISGRGGFAFCGVPRVCPRAEGAIITRVLGGVELAALLCRRAAKVADVPRPLTRAHRINLGPEGCATEGCATQSSEDEADESSRLQDLHLALRKTRPVDEGAVGRRVDDTQLASFCAEESAVVGRDITGCGSTRVILGSRPTAREFCRSTRKTSSLLSGATKVTSKSDCTPTCAMEGGSETFDYYR